jgi:capsular polysaccharide biosynthesis protein
MMNENSEKQMKNDDEIDLRELFATIWNYKALIVTITILFVVGGMVYAYTKTPVYAGNALIEVGEVVNDVNDVESLSKISLDNVNDLAQIVPKATGVGASVPKKTGLIELKSMGTDRAKIRKKLETAVLYSGPMRKCK